jgi:ABC-type transport system involved in cytochrome c biogenesis permease subunit
MKRSMLLLASLLLPVSLPAADQEAVEALGRIAVQDGGRVKPLDTFARESARRVGGARAFGAESMQGQEPATWLLSMMADPDRWKGVAMIRVAQADLRAAVGLAADRDRYSFDELVGNTRFLAAVDKLQARFDLGREPKLLPVEEALSSVYGTLNLLAGIFSGDGLKCVPPDAAGDEEWRSLNETRRPEAARLRLLSTALLGAYREGDRAAAATAANALSNRLAALAPAAYPSAARIGLEVRYNRAKPFRMAWVLYLFGAGLALARLALGGRARAGLALVAAGWLVHTYGLVLRVLIAERAPVSNMYESVVFVAWGAVLLALALEWTQRVGYAAPCAGLLAVAALVTADSVPIMDGAINPLVPVLRDNFWLTTHVLTISLGYAAFLLAAGLAHVSLGLWLLAPVRSRASRLPILLYRSLQAGTLLLAAGTLLGGIWASYSWGRFWGWDPKETWALIALLGYLSLLHARSAGVLRDFGMAVGSLLSFLLVLMAWYGVNFILGTGLHSYGFGSGGYGYVGGFAGAELAIVALSLFVWRRRHSPQGVAGLSGTPARA